MAGMRRRGRVEARALVHAEVLLKAYGGSGRAERTTRLRSPARRVSHGQGSDYQTMRPQWDTTLAQGCGASGIVPLQQRGIRPLDSRTLTWRVAGYGGQSATQMA